MASDVLYYPSNGQYWPVESTIYAQYYGSCPNPCRKYHVASALEGADIVAGIVLPYLASREIYHKVVKSRSLLSKQLSGKQAGKFITIYMQAHVSLRNPTLQTLGKLLGEAEQDGRISQGPKIPRSRPYSNIFIEMPIDSAGFIYGGSIVDPTK